MTAPTKGGLAAIALAAAMMAGGGAMAPAAAQQDWRGGERAWSDRDMDRYGRQQFDRGYRMGRDEERRSMDRRQGRSGQDWERREYERGFQMGRDDERRMGRQGHGYGGDRGAWRGESGWFSGADPGLFD